MPRVLISAGHTSMDPGDVFQDLREADLTRKIAPKVIPHLESAGIEVQGVPLDLPLWQRIQWINNTGYHENHGDVLVEVHINNGDGNKSGVEAWFKGEGNNASHRLAHAVTTKLDESGYKNQGIKSEFEHVLGSLTFLSRPNPTPLLLEALYMDHPEDGRKLRDDREIEKLAKSIAEGILFFFKKDIDGKDLPQHLHPDYSGLKPYSGERRSFMSNFAKSASVPPKPTFTPPPSLNSPPAPSLGGFGNSGANNMLMDRNSRQDMIEKMYTKMLGRKPSQSDLNYFLNQGISESDLALKMAESQEHADLIKAKRELKKATEELESLKTKSRRLETALKDQKKMLDELNNLIAHKNKAISDLQNYFTNVKGMPVQVAASQDALSAGFRNPNSEGYTHKHSRSRRLFKYLLKRVK